jgi:hypothetical protein
MANGIFRIAILPFAILSAYRDAATTNQVKLRFPRKMTNVKPIQSSTPNPSNPYQYSVNRCPTKVYTSWGRISIYLSLNKANELSWILDL